MSILGTYDADHFTLSRVSHLSDIRSPSIREELGDIYQKGGDYRPLATSINSLLAQDRLVFAMTEKSLAKLMKADPSQSKDSLDGKTYKTFLAKSLGKIFICLREPTPFKDPKTGQPTDRKKRKSGIYELVHPELRAHILERIGEEGYERQKQLALEFYDRPFEGVRDTERASPAAEQFPDAPPSQSDDIAAELAPLLAQILETLPDPEYKRADIREQILNQCQFTLSKYRNVSAATLLDALTQRPECSSIKGFKSFAENFMEDFSEFCPVEARIPRELTNESISRVSAALVTKKIRTRPDLLKLLAAYGVSDKKDLSDAQAKELLKKLEALKDEGQTTKGPGWDIAKRT